jgi:hypothetical protein
MTAMLMRFVAALLVTYFLSRATLRLPLPGRGTARLAAAHALCAVVLGIWVAWLREASSAAGWIVAAQLVWFALDMARGRGTAR